MENRQDKYGYDLAHVSEDLEGVDLETADQKFINNFEFHGEKGRVTTGAGIN